jgi:hypothetical protein
MEGLGGEAALALGLISPGKPEPQALGWALRPPQPKSCPAFLRLPLLHLMMAVMALHLMHRETTGLTTWQMRGMAAESLLKRSVTFPIFVRI